MWGGAVLNPEPVGRSWPRLPALLLPWDLGGGRALPSQPCLSCWSVLHAFTFQMTLELGSEGRPRCFPGTAASACQECGEGRVSASVASLAELWGHGRRDVRLLRAPVHGQVCGRCLAFSCFCNWGCNWSQVLRCVWRLWAPCPRTGQSCFLGCFSGEMSMALRPSQARRVPGALGLAVRGQPVLSARSPTGDC